MMQHYRTHLVKSDKKSTSQNSKEPKSTSAHRHHQSIIPDGSHDEEENEQEKKRTRSNFQEDDDEGDDDDVQLYNSEVKSVVAFWKEVRVKAIGEDAVASVRAKKVKSLSS
jgi:hypothetical protein